jgi:hypothetical protein
MATSMVEGINVVEYEVVIKFPESFHELTKRAALFAYPLEYYFAVRTI